MDAQDAVDLGREAILSASVIAAPILISGMLVGLLIGLFQALTQIQEQTVAFVPKMLAMVLVLSFTMPWLFQQLIQYTRDLILNIPDTL